MFHHIYFNMTIAPMFICSVKIAVKLLFMNYVSNSREHCCGVRRNDEAEV